MRGCYSSCNVTEQCALLALDELQTFHTRRPPNTSIYQIGKRVPHKHMSCWKCCKYLHRLTTPSTDCQSQSLRQRIRQLICHMRPLTSLKLFVCTTKDGYRHLRTYVFS